MINSILERKLRRIILNHLTFIDDKGEITFTNNPSIIEKEAIKHFQTQTGPVKLSHTETLDDLLVYWKDFYNLSSTNYSTRMVG